MRNRLDVASIHFTVTDFCVLFFFVCVGVLVSSAPAEVATEKNQRRTGQTGDNAT